MTDLEFLEKEIAAWKCSPRRMMQIKGFLYYDGDHDVIHRKRTMIGEGGELEVVENLPNNRIVDNQYAKMVNQKANYLFGKPFTLSGENTAYIELLKKIFDKKFMRTLKSAGKAAYNGGIAWLYPYYNERGEFAFRFFPAYEILPFWKDSEHTELDFFIRHYVTVAYDGNQRKFIEKVELYDLNGVHLFILDGGKLIPDIVNNETADFPHVTMTDAAGNVQVFNWQRVPLIPLKANEQETPLIKKVKSLQDGINVMLSDFENNMQEDARNTILVLKNYDGTNLGEFRKNLATYGAVKVRYDGDTKGGVETLEITVNADNYKTIVEIFKKALIENAMGYDAKDDRLSGNPNQMNIQSMYSDIDTDANDTESEAQATMDDVLWFINCHLANGIVAALTAYIAISAIVAAINGVMAMAEGVKAAAQMMATGATFAETAAQQGLNAALMACPLTWIIMLILALIAVIFAVCNAIAKMTGIANSGFGVITGGVNVVIQFFKNLGLTVANIALGIGNAIAALASNMMTAFHNAICSVQSWFYNLLSTALSVIEGICSALNKLPFVEFDYSGISSAADDYAAKASEAAGNKEDYQSISDAFNEGFTTFDAFQDGWASDAFNAGAAWGDGIADKVSNFSLSDVFGQTDIPNVGDYTSGFNDTIANSGVGDSIGSIDDNTGKIKDSLEVSEEDLKYLRDIAEQEAINRFTTAEINVDMSGMQNTVNSGDDIDGFMTKLTDSVNEAVDNMTEGVHE